MDRQDVGAIDSAALQKELQEEFEACIKQVTEAVNTARPGAVINDSEEPARVAIGLLRQKIFEKAIQMKADAAEKAAFSPSAQRRQMGDKNTK